MNQLFDGPKAIPTGSDKENARIGRQPQLTAGFTATERLFDRNARYPDFAGRDADTGEIFRRFLDCHVVAIDGAAEPHGVHIIVRHYDGVART